MNIQTIIKLAVGGICAALSNFFGGFDTLFFVLISFVAIDYVTGIASAAYTGTLSSRVGFLGIFKKVCIMCVVAAAHLLERVIGTDGLRAVVIGFYIANEAISVLENVALTGVPLPEKLKNILHQLKNNEI